MDKLNSFSEIDTLCVNTLRFLSVDAVQKAESGHPGLPLDAAPMAYVLWSRLLKHNPANPHWFDRDRFILSAGHGAALLYSLLHLTGYALPLEQIMQFRQWGSITPGHPERGTTPGVEMTTGPLGQGFANGVGMAIAESQLAAHFNQDGFNIIDHFTYAIVSDGDLMEGVAAEAASLAGHLQLGKLIYLYDDNHITLSASTDMTFTEDHVGRFTSYGWHTQTVENGNDLAAIEQALNEARAETQRPSLIMVQTHIGYGSPHKQDTFEAHGSPLGVEEVRLTKHNLGWPEDALFYVPESVRAQFQDALAGLAHIEQQWNEQFRNYQAKFPELAVDLQQRMVLGNTVPTIDWEKYLPQFPADAKGLATRVASGMVMNAIAPHLPALMGGAADLSPSTMTALKGWGDFQPPGLSTSDQQGSDGGGWSRTGRNIHFGVREHAMGAIINGMAAHGGTLPFGATFLIFSDYMRPAIRLAALMNLHVIYIFTHDSIALGEDGATHQPVEQLASLRAVPHLIVIRPSDANETAVAWRVAIELTNQPVALVLSRQTIPTLDRTHLAKACDLERGAYILAEAPNGIPELILIASGSEVTLIVEAQKQLAAQHIQARVVSMPCWELFEQQSQEYREAVFPSTLNARLAVEAGVAQGWHRYVGADGDVLAVDRFGTSAKGEKIMSEYGFTVENICARARALLKSL